MNPLYDLTGMNVSFRTENREFMIYSPNQIVDFGTAVYINPSTDEYRLRVFKVNNGGTVTELASGVDYNTTNFSDTNAISIAKLQDPSFNKVLINKIQMTDGSVSPSNQYKIRVSYQYFEQSMLNIASDYPSGPVCSPELLKTYAVTLDYLLNTKSNTIGTVAIPSVLALTEDWTGLSPNNYIEKGETHVVNVSNYRQIIRPIAGSFYGYGIKLYNASTGNEIPQHEYDFNGTLIKTNYVITGCNLRKTAGCSHPSGVFDYIFVTTPINGGVTMTYHAFGGEATTTDILSLRDSIMTIVNTLNSDAVLTAESLGNTDIIREQDYRLSIIEESLRHYPISTFVVDPTDAQYPIDGSSFHWFNIAMIYKDAWFNSMVPKQSYGTIRVALTNRGIIYDIEIRQDLNRSDLQLQAKTVACIDNNSFVDSYQVNSDITSSLSTDIDLKLRLVWVDRSNTEPNQPKDYPDGLVLQLGFIASANEVIKIVDRTGHDSDFTLYKGIDTPIHYTDDNIVLPSGEVWVDGTETHKSSIAIICPTDGYLAWSGNYECSLLTSESDEFTELTLRCGSNPSISKYINKIRFKFYNRTTGKYLADDIIRVYDGEDDASGSTMFYPDDLCAIRYQLTVEESNKLKFKVLCDLGTKSIADNTFELRQIIFYF